MKSWNTSFTRAAAASLALAVLSGCAVNMPVPITEPAASTVAYTKGSALKPLNLAFRNDQSDADKAAFMTGTIPMNPMYKDKPLESVNWIAEQTVREMVARGLPVTLAQDGSEATRVSVKRVHIENYRASGFSPFVTFTSARADVETPQGMRRVTAYVKRAKVPVWSFNEVIDPTFNEPLSLLTKELAAKLNQQFFQQVVGTDQVESLAAKIDRDAATRGDAYLDVYQLGFSNNPAAIPHLVRLSSHSSEYVRLAALSSLGILKAQGQLGFLIGRFEAPAGIWQDRAMALKAIGDLDTPESRAYLEKQLSKFSAGTDKEAMWTKEIIGLYL
ncbi:HEAT repeat domain-containing protein [Massilia sp. Dwa41.01b]|uniref:HEAT repeat domain-containing protein n=1 Tax=unclassified Massilia TaxID=2609279 RepID=UPI001603AF5E|nr:MULTISPECIES: HEAT repeat domain-containing protein [unclassified Massilia]QNA87756.1 HEAT repeat domain-containing protein [Massilia sp. Dwa41.01b]QNA98661.1 HEAT repeat domain-containing protein [Massilia sp. Se16.2.3]